MEKLERYEITEVESSNHFLTVELQFDNPITKRAAQSYLDTALKKANEANAEQEKQRCKQIFNGERRLEEPTRKKHMTIQEIVFCLKHVPQNEHLIVDGKFVTEVFTEEDKSGNLCVGLITEE